MQFSQTINLPHDLDGFDCIIDVRSPAEFAMDHVPGAINLPVLTDDERIEVGTIYKQSPFEARKIGAAMISRNVSKHLSEALADKPLDFRPLLYCWRGGMRSRSIAFILRSVGWDAYIIKGGYHTFRKFVISETERLLETQGFQFEIISGFTGVGKTRVLEKAQELGKQVLDLEGLANHKGSLLGGMSGGQPSQKQFDTRIWQVLSQADPAKPIYVEAESNRIGKLHQPPALWKKLASAQVTQLSMPLDDRVRFLLDDYPYLVNNPEQLIVLLNHLRRLRGNEQVDTWIELIHSDQWHDLVKSLLEHHYDLSYRMPGSGNSNYPSPRRTIEIPEYTEKAIEEAARAL